MLVALILTFGSISGAHFNPAVTLADASQGGLASGRKLLLAGAGMLAVTGPVAIGLMNSSQVRARSQPPAGLTFEAASVKAHPPGDRNFAIPALGPGRLVSRAPLAMAVSYAYDLPFNQSVRLRGVPDWARSMDAAYDIEANGGRSPGRTLG
jgi:hypothetical protein